MNQKRKTMEKHIGTYNQMISSYTTRLETLEEKEHIVVPVVMMVEGVHAGSRGPLLHLANEFGHVPASYNGIPVTIHHPQDDEGNYVSANSPDVLKDWSVGRIFNAKLEKKKLKAEAWVEKAKCQTLSQETLTALESGTILEVSIGVFTDEEETPGTYGAEQYNAVAKNHKPDHLALLPGATGACSVKDGCGIRVNKQFKTNKDVEVLTAIDVLKESGYKVPTIQDNSEMGLEQKLDQLRDLVRSLNPPYEENATSREWNYLKEAYDSYLIYEQEVSNNGKYTEKYFKRNYQFNVKDNTAEFTSEPVQVIKTVEYKAVPVMNSLIRTKFNANKGEQTMSDEKCTPCVKERVDKLIQANKFCEDDRMYLESLEIGRLDKFLEEKAVPQVNTAITKEAALNALKSVSMTDEEYLGLLPTETQDKVKYGMTAYEAQKTSMVDRIIANTAEGTWTKEELTAMPIETLTKVSNTIKVVEDVPPMNFSLFGLNKQQTPAPVNNASQVEPLGLPGIVLK